MLPCPKTEQLIVPQNQTLTRPNGISNRPILEKKSQYLKYYAVYTWKEVNIQRWTSVRPKFWLQWQARVLANKLHEAFVIYSKHDWTTKIRNISTYANVALHEAFVIYSKHDRTTKIRDISTYANVARDRKSVV